MLFSVNYFDGSTASNTFYQTLCATPSPKIIILVGTDAISGGIFADSPAIDRSFLEKHTIDLYIPGNPAHPLAIINGILSLLGE